LTTLTCEVIVQQLTTHNKHQFHDSQSSSHHTKQTLQLPAWCLVQPLARTRPAGAGGLLGAMIDDGGRVG
jgi:hypothetical protein